MLPEIGYMRLPQIIGDRKRGIPPVIPVSRATWWRGVGSGKYPAGVLQGPRIRMWSVESIRALVEQMGTVTA
jgi:hypothetical protein